ncbi:MAG: sulfurtransferase TusA family protein [Pseudomonadota bacterium]|nr:sulfurtransferase TusA family protein [Pseudomonadota bacterium]
MAEHELDARNLICPLPVIRTQDRVESLAFGDILNVYCTDPGALNDIPAWCRINGHRLLEAREENGEVRVRLQVAGDSAG